MTGWKTLAFNGSLGSLAIVAELLDELSIADWTKVLPADRLPLVVIGVTLFNILLRHVTHGQAGWSREAQTSERKQQ
ncbi:MAG: hypothetical protein HWE23_04310 [Rhodobacteraceae bacterium]|nr:hypothetical protein [Paracoccaceae bacterium]